MPANHRFMGSVGCINFVGLTVSVESNRLPELDDIEIGLSSSCCCCSSSSSAAKGYQLGFQYLIGFETIEIK